MKKTMIRLAALMVAAVTAGCSQPIKEDIPPDTDTSLISESGAPDVSPSGYIPLNYTEQVGLWLPYMRFSELMYNKSEDEYRAGVSKLLAQAQQQGINTLYFHVHPSGDAYYRSDIFPVGAYLDGAYDPLEIAVEEAHARGISLHAWINPMRLQTSAQMEQLPDSFIVKQWSQQPEKGYVKLIGDRYYLVPVYAEVRQLVCDCAAELLERYQLDGVHIDDYFYPTTDPSFDAEAFAESGSSDLAQWRRDNVTELVRSLCETVHTHGRRCKFGISPQGNISTDREKLYADVELWSSDTRYCDYIVPQLYFGFDNETCPFEPTLRRWEELTADSSVSLIAGLAEYKLGKEDVWAGESGKNEWVTSPDIIERQIELVKSSSADGYALYR